jgi:hypothetical protein
MNGGSQAQLPLDVAAILVFVDIHDEAQLDLFRVCSFPFDELGVDSAPIVLIPHSEAPETRVEHSEDQHFRRLSRALQLGADMVLTEESQGLKLAHEVCMEMEKQTRLMRSIDNIIQMRLDEHDYVRILDRILQR